MPSLCPSCGFLVVELPGYDPEECHACRVHIRAWFRRALKCNKVMIWQRLNGKSLLSVRQEAILEEDRIQVDAADTKPKVAILA
jgi:hypothetical protein